MNYQRGMSLSEVLIGLFLSSLIIIITTQFYLSSKKQYLEAEEILSKNFDVQWVIDLLSDSIRRAGFTPCLGVDQLIAIDRRKKDERIEGLKVRNPPQQLIHISRMAEQFSQVKQIKNTTEILVEYSSFNIKRPLLIADCEHAEVHNIQYISVQHDNVLLTLAEPLKFHYSDLAYVGEFLNEEWLIKKNIKNESALYYHSQHIEEVTPLITSLHSDLKQSQGKHLVKIIMGLSDASNQELSVMMRGT